MTFTVEDDALQKSGEIILGTYANLSCLYKSQEWLNGFFWPPFIKFFRLDKDGYETEIKDSHEKPPRYENQGEIEVEVVLLWLLERESFSFVVLMQAFLQLICAGCKLLMVVF